MNMKILYYPDGEPDPRVFPSSNIALARCKQTVDPLFGDLPEMSIEVELCLPSGVCPQREEKLELYWNGLLCATGYIKNSQRLPGDHYRLQAGPRLDRLYTRHLGGMYNNAPLLPLWEELTKDIPATIDINMTDKTVSGYLDLGTRADSLRQLTFGAGAALGIETNGQLRLRDPETEDKIILPAHQICRNLLITALPVYTQFQLTSHTYVPGNYEVKLKDNEEFRTGELTLTFSRPYYNYQMFSELGGQLLEEGPNHVVLTCQGPLTLYAKPYIHIPRILELNGKPVADPDFSYVMTVSDRTLVHEGNMHTLMHRMHQLGQLRLRVNATVMVRPGEVPPRAGDPVELPTPWGTVIRGYVSKIDAQYRENDLEAALTVWGKEEEA